MSLEKWILFGWAVGLAAVLACIIGLGVAGWISTRRKA